MHAQLESYVQGGRGMGCLHKEPYAWSSKGHGHMHSRLSAQGGRGHCAHAVPSLHSVSIASVSSKSDPCLSVIYCTQCPSPLCNLNQTTASLPSTALSVHRLCAIQIRPPPLCRLLQLLCTPSNQESRKQKHCATLIVICCVQTHCICAGPHMQCAGQKISLPSVS